MSTRFPSGQEIARKWYVVDATGQTLGRLASRVASILAGKESPIYTPFLDTGDHVIVVNAGKIRVTGMKAEQKLYHRYTGFPGGLRTEDFRKRFDRKPELVVQEAILGMLPKSKLGRAMGKKLKVYKGDKHDHQAQQPKPLALVERKGA
ncbi:MAG TPA: 50S ribosomal protein L13 [Candidatus Angelobacter sp.]|jgi:large subunit ribosomal protein L13|nr:50S ribosomal protein L13 [Candidatus Angelobacter sp.]